MMVLAALLFGALPISIVFVFFYRDHRRLQKARAEHAAYLEGMKQIIRRAQEKK